MLNLLLHMIGVEAHLCSDLHDRPGSRQNVQQALLGVWPNVFGLSPIMKIASVAALLISQLLMTIFLPIAGVENEKLGVLAKMLWGVNLLWIVFVWSLAVTFS